MGLAITDCERALAGVATLTPPTAPLNEQASVDTRPAEERDPQRYQKGLRAVQERTSRALGKERQDSEKLLSMLAGLPNEYRERVQRIIGPLPDVYAKDDEGRHKERHKAADATARSSEGGAKGDERGGTYAARHSARTREVYLESEERWRLSRVLDE